jgi:cysteine desulfurase
MNAGKISGPKGVGVLFIRDGVKIVPWTIGGGQEFKMRAGTENVAAIVGMGKAVELVHEQRNADTKRVLQLRDTLWKLVQEQIPNGQLNGTLEHRVANNLNILIEGVDGETLVRKLDLMGIAVSTGSACASGTVEPSHVLMAIGRTPAEAKSSIRITLGRTTTENAINTLAQALSKAVIH